MPTRFSRVTSSREYPPHPRVGVGSVVFRDDSVLLIRRGKPPKEGEWSLPGGLQQLGETVFAAAEREVAEETGITMTVLGVVAVIDLIESDTSQGIRYHYTLIDVAAEWSAGEARAASDAAAVAWVALDDLAAWPMWSETKRVINDAVQFRSCALQR